MTLLPLTLACWDYDRVAALRSGDIRPDGIDLRMLSSNPEETFFRMARHREFDVSELSMSSYAVTLMADEPPFVAIPVFPSRMFRHGCIFVSAKSGIERPEDLRGKRVGVPEYQMTAPCWIRGIMADDYCVMPEDVEHWFGGLEEPNRPEKLKLDLPSTIRLRPIGPGQTLSQMLADGEIDALFTARTPSTFTSRPGTIRRLFPDFVATEQDYYRRTSVFPIMHVIAIRREVYLANRWIAQSLLKAFTAAKAKTLQDLRETAAMKAMLPWTNAAVEEAQALIGADWWPYGFGENRHVLETFTRYHHAQGLSQRLLLPEEMFAPETLEKFVV